LKEEDLEGDGAERKSNVYSWNGPDLSQSEGPRGLRNAARREEEAEEVREPIIGRKGESEEDRKITRVESGGFAIRRTCSKSRHRKGVGWYHRAMSIDIHKGKSHYMQPKETH